MIPPVSVCHQLSWIGSPKASLPQRTASGLSGSPTLSPDEQTVYLWEEGFHLFFPMRGTDHWRVVGIVPPSLRGRDDLTFEDVIPSLRT